MLVTSTVDLEESNNKILHLFQVLIIGLSARLDFDAINLAAQPVIKGLILFNLWGGYGAEHSVADAVFDSVFDSNNVEHDSPMKTRSHAFLMMFILWALATLS